MIIIVATAYLNSKANFFFLFIKDVVCGSYRGVCGAAVVCLA